MSLDFVTKPVRERARRLFESSEADVSAIDTAMNELVLKFAVLVGLVGLITMTIGLVKPVLMAGLFAATLYPFHKKLKSRVPSNTARSALLTLVFAILFFIPLGAVVFLATSAGLKKLKSLPDDWMSQLQVEPLLQKIEAYLPFDHADIMKHLEQAGTAVGKTAFTMLQGLLTDIPKLIIVDLVILFGVYVMLVNAQQILSWLHRMSPLSREGTDRLFTTIGGLSASSVLATILSGLVQAVVLGIVLLVVGWPGAVLITMCAFVLSFVPLIGTMPVSLYLIVSAAIAGDWTHVTVFVITAGVVGVSDNIVRPYVLSDSAKLNAFIGFVAAVGALETMGFYGLFLGPVVAGAVFKLVELVHEVRNA